MTNEEAVKGYKGLVEAIARKFKRRGVELEDLIQEGYLGLFKAVDEWEAGRGASFETIANGRIRNAIRDYLTGERSNVSLDAALSSGEDESGVSLLESPSARMMGIEDAFTAPNQEELASRVETIEAVRSAMGNVSEDDRAMLSLWDECYVHADEMPNGGTSGAVPEMARRLGKPRQTVQRHTDRAMRHLGVEVLSKAS